MQSYKEFGNIYQELTSEKKEEKKIEEYKQHVNYNLNLLEETVSKHQETKFIFIIPPYSSLWWYEAYMCGDLNYNFYSLNEFFERMLDYGNVEVYYFQNMEEIISDLSLFMDFIHYHPDINKKLVESIGDSKFRVTKENKEELLNNMYKLAEKCINVYAKEYLENLQKK